MCIEKANTAQILVRRSYCLVTNMPSKARLVSEFRFEFFSHFKIEKFDSTKVVFANDIARGWEVVESLVPSLHRVPGAIEHCRVILCIDVLLQFNLDSIILNQLHVTSFHVLNFTRCPEPWQMGTMWIQDVMNEIPWMQMNKLGRHYQRHLRHSGLIVGVSLNLDLTQLID